MPKSSTTYNDAWEKEFDFLTPGKKPVLCSLHNV